MCSFRYIGQTFHGMTMNLDILAIGAHPDDIELSCGGTIIKLVKQGHKVGILDLTAGELGTRGTPQRRAEEAAEAARLMGTTVRTCLQIPDGNIENTMQNRLKVVEVIRAFKPDVLLFPYPVDRHPDHEHAHVLCREAWFAAGLEKIRTRHRDKDQEPHRPRAFYHYMQWFEFPPSFIVDVTEEFELRMKVMRAFKSQFHDPKSTERETVLSKPEFIEMIITKLEYYGDRIGVRYGEPFFSPQAIAVNDLYSLNA
jgi:N-acetylglucosamine malate deacetylase 1